MFKSFFEVCKIELLIFLGLWGIAIVADFKTLCLFSPFSLFLSPILLPHMDIGTHSLVFNMYVYRVYLLFCVY